jgi:hypothetical protein
MRRLYTVTVRLEYAVIADSALDAESYVDDALRDAASDLDVHARFMRQSKGVYVYPDGYSDNSLVYGVEGDLTLSEAVKAEKAELDQETA